MTSSTRRRFAVSLLPVMALLSGCAVYLHDDGLQKRTGAALEAYKSADVPGAIKATIAAQAAFDQRMLDSVITEDAALRDLELAQLLKNGDAKTLETAITDRFKVIGGDAFVFDPKAWQGRLAARDLARLPADAQRRQVAIFARAYKQAGGKNFESCEKPFERPAGASAALQAAHGHLLATCTVLNTFAATEKSAADKFQQLACSVNPGSLLADSCVELQQVAAEIDADKQAASRAKDLLAAVKKRVDDEKAKGTLEEKINDVLTDVTARLAEADEVAGYIGKGKFQPSAALATVEFRSTNICDVLAASSNSSCSGDQPASDAAKNINKAIVGAIAGFAKVTGLTKVPETDVLSMALAHQTGLQAAAELSLGGMLSKQALLARQQDALVREVEYLIESRTALESAKGTLNTGACAVVGLAEVLKKKECKSNSVARALTSYSFAWAEGRTAARIAMTRATQQITMTNLQVAQANAVARDAVLTTALSELDAFGKGGVSPQTLAEFLQAFGVAAIANGVN